MDTPFDLAGLPMEVFGLVLEHLFDDLTIKTSTPTQLSRLNQIIEKDSSLFIFKVLAGSRHSLAKEKLLKSACFEFSLPINPGPSFSTFYKHLDQIHNLSIDFHHLRTSISSLVNPYQYTKTQLKWFTPFQTAEMLTRWKSLRVLKIKRTFPLGDESHVRTVNLIYRSGITLRDATNTALEEETTGTREGAADILKLGREKISDRCRVILELSFTGYQDKSTQNFTASICKGRIIALTAAREEDVKEVTAELNKWFKSTVTVQT